MLKMKYILFFSFLLSFNVFADELSHFEKYQSNYPLLLEDISKMEVLLKKEKSTLYQEILNDLNVLKNDFFHLSNVLRLETFHDEVKEKGWIFLAELSKELILICESKTSRNLTLCQKGMSRIKSRVLDSSLLYEEKKTIMVFVNDYLLQVNVQGVINDEFIMKFNENILIINLKLKEEAMKASAIVIKKPSSVKLIPVDKNQNFVFSENMFFLNLALMFSVFGAFYYCKIKYKKNKIIKNFHKDILTVGDSFTAFLEVSGQVHEKHAEVIEKIKLPFLSALNLSQEISQKTNLNFINRNKSILVEINCFTSRSFQHVLSYPKEKSLEKSIAGLQEIVESNRGEFIFTSRFNSSGDLVESGFCLQLTI